MKIIVLSVYDAVAGIYGRPFFSTAKGVAVRDFTDEVNRPAEDNMLYKHPSDFSLYHLGFFDDKSGSFDLVTPTKIVSAADVVTQKDL